MHIGPYETAQRERARALRDKFYPVPKERKTVPVIEVRKPIEWIPPKPSWMKTENRFDAHVIESRRILEMIKSGEIDITRMNNRTIVDIVAEVLERFPGVTPAMVKGYGRQPKTVEARHECIYAVREERQDLSYPAIGRWFNRDHTSILASYYKMAGKYGNSELQEKYERKMTRITNYYVPKTFVRGIAR